MKINKQADNTHKTAQVAHQVFTALFKMPLRRMLKCTAVALLLAWNCECISAVSSSKLACDLITQAEAQAALGESVNQAEDGPNLKTLDTSISYCSYTGADLPSVVGIVLSRAPTVPMIYQSLVSEAGKHVDQVKGLGAEAHIWFEGDNGTIVVRNGNEMLQIGIQHFQYRDDQWQKLKRVSVQTLRTLAEAALKRAH